MSEAPRANKITYHSPHRSSFTLSNIFVIEIAVKYGLSAFKHGFNNRVKENILHVMNQSKTRKRVGPLIIREVKLTEACLVVWLLGVFSSSALVLKKADCALKTTIIKTREEG